MDDRDVRLKEAQRDRREDGSTSAQVLFRGETCRGVLSKRARATVTYILGVVIGG
jgi:hypothetical protein